LPNNRLLGEGWVLLVDTLKKAIIGKYSIDSLNTLNHGHDVLETWIFPSEPFGYATTFCGELKQRNRSL